MKTIEQKLEELEPLKKEFDNKVIESNHFKFIFKRTDVGLKQGSVEIINLETNAVYETNFAVNKIKGEDYIGINLISEDLPQKLRVGIKLLPKDEFICYLKLL
ncbi:MAG TPA: hypothetical protein VIN08_04075 [Ohtaekwangia sp.]|uniref:hypothetical protein n=1 Tax=Ohtaekwangia sp. TaxID=2066019 RepID=UPI002F93DEFB